jgi:hypothetical protein
MQKKPIIIIAVLSVLALGLGYWVGLPKEGSGPPLSPLPGSKEPKFLKQGLVAYYPFNGNAKDESGKGTNGEVNSATLAEDRKGQAASAYSFDGEDDYIYFASSPGLREMQSVGVAFWVKPDATQKIGAYGYNYIIARWQDHLQGTFVFCTKNNSNIAVNMWPNHDHAPVVKGIDPDVWTHVAYNHDSFEANLYINGAKVFTNIKLEKDLKECDPPLIFGGNLTGVDVLERPFKGSLDDVRIYNRALSEAEVKALYEFEKAN